MMSYSDPLRHLLLCCLTGMTLVDGDAQSLDWARRVGGSSWDESVALALDAEGNAFFGGWMYEDLTSNTVNGPVNLINNGNRDAIIGKFSTDGELLWVYSFGGAQTDIIESVATDPAGNVIATGMFQFSIDVEPGPGVTTLTSVTSNAPDAFIVKYSPVGTLIWAKSLGGPGSQIGHAITCDSQGSVFSVGAYSNTIDMDPGEDAAVLQPLGGAPDLYLSKLSSGGSFLYGGAFAASLYNYVHDIHVDAEDHVFVFGNCYGAGDFDPGPDTLMLNATFGHDPFLLKFDNDCDLFWALQFGGDGHQYGHGVTTDSQGNILLTGYFTSAGDFDPGPDTLTMTPELMPFADMYISKLDPDGALIWSRQIGGTSNEYSYDIATDAADRVYTTGYITLSEVDFDPGPGEFWLDPNGADVHLSVLDSDGGFLWAGHAGANDEEKGYALALDGNGKVFITGSFHNTPDFDMGTGVSTLTSAGQQDIYMLKHDMDPADFITESRGWTLTTFPNPTSGTLFVRGLSTLGNPASYILKDVQGRSLGHGSLARDAGVDVSELSAGIYTILVQDAGRTLIGTFVKQ
ncbi:MAG TPA: SBBP repeat-containing protein [Flavobacteriales bacterium]|nr:SBBP repeat-containing protein [Flavobacteriales bacterium]